jgi:hypothetical protein
MKISNYPVIVDHSCFTNPKRVGLSCVWLSLIVNAGHQAINNTSVPAKGSTSWR